MREVFIMKVAIIGSRSFTVADFGNRTLADYIPTDTTEIVTSGANGIDTCVLEYAAEHGITYRRVPTDDHCYKRDAAVIQKSDIVRYADYVITFWDGKSKEAGSVVKYCMEINKTVRIIKYTFPKSSVKNPD